jgi:hypothetical protein
LLENQRAGVCFGWKGWPGGTVAMELALRRAESAFPSAKLRQAQAIRSKMAVVGRKIAAWRPSSRKSRIAIIVNSR